MGIALSNIENFLYLFDGLNASFPHSGWAEPIYAAMIRAYQNDKRLDVTIANEYIRKMILSDYQENRSYSPIEIVRNRNGLEAISTHLSDIMLKNFSHLHGQDKRDLRDYLQYLFLELMNNVADHAHADGYVMAQYFPNNKKIQFVVADRGVGFLENMQLNYKDICNEEDAIFKALQKGVTSTRQKMYGHEKNAGYGLYAMFEILKMTGGRFVIISNDTLLRYESENFEVIQLNQAWKGVVVSFEFDESEINFDMDYFKRNFLWNEIIDEEDEDFF